MRIFITGFSGFVAKHFIDCLEKNKIESEIFGVDINKPEIIYDSYNYLSVKFEELNLLDYDHFRNLIITFKPDYILHLASYSSVGFSWKNPALSFRNNMDIFLNLVEIVRANAPACRILSVGSSEGYGNVDSSLLPLREKYSLKPSNPYAVARVAQEQLSKIYCNGYGLDIVMTRSFNHIGPGQKEDFVISSFAKQLVEIKKGIRKEKKLITGDIAVIRDFLDVRDVVEAYYSLFIDGIRGEVYNICSGHGISLNEVIDMICGILDIEVELQTDLNLMRPNENKVIIGSNEKLKNLTAWSIQVELKKSLEDIVKYWDEKI